MICLNLILNAQTASRQPYSSYSAVSNQYISAGLATNPVTLNGGKFVAGVYFVAPAFHVLDVLKLATDSLKIEDIPRNIQVDGETIDIMQYLCKNDQSQNPIVKAGMQIYVPFPNKTILIKGDYQNNFGKITIKDNDNLQNVISLLTLNPTAETNSVEIMRNNTVLIVNKSQYGSFALNNNDVINIRTFKSLHLPEMVEVRGEVDKKGYYAITLGVTKVADILQQAQSLGTGDTSRILIYRKASSTRIQSARPEVFAGLENATNSFPVFCNLNTTLNDKDIIEIPKKDFGVYVTGYVKKPGTFLFANDKVVRNYLEMAGGLTRAADKHNIRVMTLCGVSYNVRDVKTVQPGDIIMVPEGIESKWVKTWVPIITVIGSTASVIAAAAAAIRIAN